MYVKDVRLQAPNADAAEYGRTGDSVTDRIS